MAGQKYVEEMMKSVNEFELTDDNLEKLYSFTKRMKAAGADDNPAAAMQLARESGWNMIAYGKAIMKFQGLRHAVRRGPEKITKDYEEAKARLAKLEERLADAPEKDKRSLQAQITSSKMMLTAMGGSAESVEKLKDADYRAMLEKWFAKFDALDDD